MIEQTPIVKVRVSGFNLPIKNEFANLFIRKNLTLYQIWDTPKEQWFIKAIQLYEWTKIYEVNGKNLKTGIAILTWEKVKYKPKHLIWHTKIKFKSYEYLCIK